MKQYLDETDKIIAIRLQLRHPLGAEKVWVLVEGESDQRLFGKFIGEQNPNTSVEQVHGGLSSLQKAMKILTQETKQVIGIRDADFLHLEGKAEDIPFLYLTDYHDAEMMMIASDETLASIIAEYLDVNLHQPKLLRNQLLESISFLGCVRWHNHQRNSRLNFEGLAISKFYDIENLTIRIEACIYEIHNRSPNQTVVLEKSVVQSLQTEETDLLQLSNGHDFEKVFALLTTRHGSKGVKDKEIGTALRLAYTKEEFKKTILFALLQEWEKNSGYSLFA